MNAETSKKLTELAKAHKWTDFIETAPIGEPIPILFESVQEMNAIRAVAARASSKADVGGRVYSFSGIDYINLAMCVTAAIKK